MQDIQRQIGRREALALIGATGAALTAACAGDSPTSPTAATGATTTTTTATTTSGGAATGAACAVTPTETIGPYPSLIDLFRSDIREGKSGTQLDLAITVVNTATSCAPIAFPDSVNADVYGSGVYASRGNNPTTNTRDMIFADSINSEMASVAGNPSSGYSATFTIGMTA